MVAWGPRISISPEWFFLPKLQFDFVCFRWKTPLSRKWYNFRSKCVFLMTDFGSKKNQKLFRSESKTLPWTNSKRDISYLVSATKKFKKGLTSDSASTWFKTGIQRGFWYSLQLLFLNNSVPVAIYLGKLLKYYLLFSFQNRKNQKRRPLQSSSRNSNPLSFRMDLRHNSIAK